LSPPVFPDLPFLELYLAPRLLSHAVLFSFREIYKEQLSSAAIRPFFPFLFATRLKRSQRSGKTTLLPTSDTPPPPQTSPPPPVSKFIFLDMTVLCEISSWSRPIPMKSNVPLPLHPEAHLPRPSGGRRSTPKIVACPGEAMKRLYLMTGFLSPTPPVQGTTYSPPPEASCHPRL